MRMLLRRIVHLLRRRRHETDLREEMETHRSLRQAALERDGMSATEAARASRCSLGSVTLAEEDVRGVWMWVWLESVWQDIRFAARSLRKSPAFTLTAILTLALGIGANGAVFSVADATAFRPPDIPRPGELVRLFSTSRETPFGEVSYPDYLDFRSRLSSVTGLVAYEILDFSLARTSSEVGEYVGGLAVSGNFFSGLEVTPTLGRGLGTDDERRDANVAVISHRLWRRHFQADPAVVGSLVRLSGAEFVIVGVLPDGFSGTELYFHPDLFVPLSAIHSVFPRASADLLEDRSDRWLTVVGRLRDSSSVAAANDEVTALARSLEVSYPKANQHYGAAVRTERAARAELDYGGYQGAVIMMGLVILVLLLTSANVANLVVARSAARTAELALRATIGATRARLVRLGLTESLLIAVIGAVAALLVAWVTIRYLSGLLIFPSALPIAIDLRLDGRVLLSICGAALLAGLLFGLVPAISAAKAAGLSWQTRTATVTGHRRFGARGVFLTLQLGISLVLLVASGVLVRAALAATRVDPGFRTDHVLVTSFNPGMVRYDQARAARFYDEVLGRVRALPGVTAAGLTRFVPMGTSSGTTPLVVDGVVMPEGQKPLNVAYTVVDDKFWDVLRTPIVRGRRFDSRDTASSTPVVVINETMAGRYWPNIDPIGKVVRMPDASGRAVEVIGVARNSEFGRLADPPRPFIYRLYAQSPRVAMSVVVLANGDPAALAPAVRGAVQSIGDGVPMFDLRTLDEHYRWFALGPSRVMSTLVTALGVLGLSVVAVGLYGVVAYLCAQRTREIGIRVAVGATPGEMFALVTRQAGQFAFPGVLLGLGAAFLLMPLIGAPAFDFVVPRDPIVFGVATLVVAGVVTAAAAIPALRASRVDPVVALRTE